MWGLLLCFCLWSLIIYFLFIYFGRKSGSLFAYIFRFGFKYIEKLKNGIIKVKTKKQTNRFSVVAF